MLRDGCWPRDAGRFYSLRLVLTCATRSLVTQGSEQDMECGTTRVV